MELGGRTAAGLIKLEVASPNLVSGYATSKAPWQAQAETIFGHSGVAFVRRWSCNYYVVVQQAVTCDLQTVLWVLGQFVSGLD